MPLSRTATQLDVATRTKVRYVILALISVITTLNYADRVTPIVIVKEIKRVELA